MAALAAVAQCIAVDKAEALAVAVARLAVLRRAPMEPRRQAQTVAQAGRESHFLAVLEALAEVLAVQTDTTGATAQNGPQRAVAAVAAAVLAALAAWWPMAD
jgi:hypothetical protein